MPPQLTALASDGTPANDPGTHEDAFTEFAFVAFPPNYANTAVGYFIGSGCGATAICMPLAAGSLIRDYRCGPGHSCRTNPCAADSYCPANLYDPATNTCGGACVGCGAGLSCIRSVYGNETDYGCANGYICLPGRRSSAYQCLPLLWGLCS